MMLLQTTTGRTGAYIKGAFLGNKVNLQLHSSAIFNRSLTGDYWPVTLNLRLAANWSLRNAKSPVKLNLQLRQL